MNKVLIILSLALLSACGGEPSSQTSAGEAVTETKPVALGEPGKAGGVEITIDSVKTMSQIGPVGLGPKAEPTETFVIVKYRLKNTGAKALGLMERPTLSLVDAGGQSYASDDPLGMLTLEPSEAASAGGVEINPGVSIKWAGGWKIAKQGFDKATWKIVASTDPALTFALK